VLKKVMLEFDHERLDTELQETYVMEQLMAENAQLRGLLMIHERHGLVVDTVEAKLGRLES
jgi:hypothetical protein